MFSSTSRKGSLEAAVSDDESDDAGCEVRTDDVGEALAAVLAAFEAEEAFDGAEEAVLELKAVSIRHPIPQEKTKKKQKGSQRFSMLNCGRRDADRTALNP